MKTRDLIFLFSFIFYITIGLAFAVNTSLVFHPEYKYDLFFGYDNLLHDTSTFRHPLLTIFPLIGDYLQTYFSPKTISIIIIVFCSSLLSIQNRIAYKFSISILNLSPSQAVLSVIIFSSFAANLINSFTIDSFILSSFLLSLYWLLYFSNFNNFREKIILGILITGVTITNSAKIWWSYLISKKSKLLNYLTLFLLVTAGFFFFLLKEKIGYLSIINYHAFNYNDGLSNIYKHFLGGVFVLPDATAFTSVYDDSTKYVNFFAKYKNTKSIILIFLCLLLMLFSYIKNRNFKVVKVLSLVFLLDILIHIVLGYGLKESHIYASHYQFLFFVLFALLIKDFYDSNYFRLITILFISILLSYNLFQLYDFYILAKLYYPR